MVLLEIPDMKAAPAGCGRYEGATRESAGNRGAPMKTLSLLILVIAISAALLPAGCSDEQPTATAKLIHFLRLIITEQTGSLESYAFSSLDPVIFERLPGLGAQEYDFATGGCEYYDIYFSSVLGEPLDIEPRDRLPEPIYVTIDCVDMSCIGGEPDNAPLWSGAGNNLDAVALTTLDRPLFGKEIVRVRYGACDEPLALNQWPADRALGPGDAIVTRMGGAFSSITMRMDFITLGALTLFEESNTPPYIFAHTFPNLDARLFEKLPELTQEHHDIATGDCELYDIYFSDADGTPLDFSRRLNLPDPVYVTIDCNDLDCDSDEPDAPQLWAGAGNNIDAVRLSFYGWHRFAGSITNLTYGACGQLPEFNEWPAENMLGPPDGSITRIGGGFSTITVQLADSSS
jgi:hypothetical protein